jgi:hypothetical protein
MKTDGVKVEKVTFGSAIMFGGQMFKTLQAMKEGVEIMFDKGVFVLLHLKSGEVSCVGMANVVQWWPSVEKKVSK